MHDRTDRSRQRRLPSAGRLSLKLLLLASLGPLYSDILLFRVGGFAFTLPHLTLALASVIVLLGPCSIDSGLRLIVFGAVLLEMSHALLFGFGYEPEWMKSFGQFSAYAVAFVMVASLEVDRTDLVAIAPWVRGSAFFFGGMGLAQFVLMNMGFSASLPAGMRVKAYGPFDELRTAGFIPAHGIAIEPSYYAIGLTTLLAVVIAFDNLGGRGRLRGTMLILLAGIVVSFSMTGLFLAGTLLAIQFFSARTSGRVRLALLILMASLIVALSGVGHPIWSRVLKVARGADNSAQIRLLGNVQLLTASYSTFETFMLGTGLGMEIREFSTYYRVYRDASLRDQVFHAVRIHNILSAVRFLQGWVGLGVYACLLWRALRLSAGRWAESAGILTFVALFHFASGLYLYPSTWAAIGLFSLLRRAQLSKSCSDQAPQIVQPVRQEISTGRV